MIRFALSAFAIATLCASAGGATEQHGSRLQQARLQKALKGLHPSAPQRCVRRDRARELRGFQDEILFVGGRDRLWRNRIVGSCPGVARGDLIVTRTRSGDYCSGDIVETRERISGRFTGSCSLGNFVPYTR